MSKQKVDRKQADIDAASPIANISVRGKNDNVDNQRHGVDV